MEYFMISGNWLEASQKLLGALSPFVDGNYVLVTTDTVGNARAMRRCALSIFNVLKLHAVQERHRGLQLKGCEILFEINGFDPYDQKTDKTYILFTDS